MKSSMLRGMSVQSSVRPVISLGGLKHGSQATRQSRSQIVRVANIAAPPAVVPDVLKGPMAKYKKKEDLQSLYEDYKKSYLEVDPATGEIEGWVTEIEGEIPLELEGTLLRNGPALFERKGLRKVFLDGDGMVSSLAIKNGKAYFRNKFVRTPGMIEEQKLGAFSRLSIFTDKDPRPALTGKPVWWHRLVDDIFMGPPSPKHNGAYNVWNWGGTLVAVDFGQPHALDKTNLDTVAPYSVHSAAKYTAHTRVLSEKDGSHRMICFSPFVDWSKYETTVTFLEFDEAGEIACESVHKFQAAYFHDLVVTENWYILFDCPISMDYFKTFVGYPSGANSLGDTMCEDRSRPPLFRMFPRPGKAANKPQVIPVTDFHCYAYHHLNGFDVDEQGDKVIFDTCTWEKFNLYFNDIVTPNGDTFFPRTELSRFQIDVKKGVATRELMNPIPSEFPTVAPSVAGRQYLHSYMGTSAVGAEGVNGPLQNLTKITINGGSDPCATCTLESWLPGEHKFAGEPLFIARANSKAEDDGWLIVLVHNCEGTPSTEIAILDAQKIKDGPVALLKLPQYVPQGVHGSWSDEYILGPV